MMIASSTADVIITDKNSSSVVPCSICLDLVIDDGDRSIAKLNCGHKFHLECIGSAFNAKGTMQCPNCRKIESGRWLFATGSAHASSEDDTLDWLQNDFPHDFSYSRRPFGFHWCPFSGFTVQSLNESVSRNGESSVANFQPSESTNMPPPRNNFRRFSGSRSMPMIMPAIPSRLYFRSSGGGLYFRDMEREEPSYPIIPGYRRVSRGSDSNNQAHWF